MIRIGRSKATVEKLSGPASLALKPSSDAMGTFPAHAVSGKASIASTTASRAEA